MTHIKNVNELFGFKKSIYKDDDIVSFILDKLNNDVDVREHYFDPILKTYDVHHGMDPEYDFMIGKFYINSSEKYLYLDHLELDAIESIVEKIYKKCRDILSEKRGKEKEYYKNHKESLPDQRNDFRKKFNLRPKNLLNLK